MSAGSREGGGVEFPNVINFMPANQNREHSLDSEPKEGKVISLVQKMKVLTRQKEVQQKSSEDLVVEAKSMESTIKKCDTSKYEASLRQLAALHSDRIDFLFKDDIHKP